MNPTRLEKIYEKEVESASEKLKSDNVRVKKPNKGIKIGSYRFGKAI